MVQAAGQERYEISERGNFVMKLEVKIFGEKEIIKNIRKAGIFSGKRVQRGMKKAGLFVQRESQKIVPVDTANLKSSAGTAQQGDGFDTVVMVFYTADYAIYVHERTDLRHAKGKFAKFLERPAREHKDRILRIIVDG